MAKDPVLPLYYNDIDSATRDWTDEEFGAYLRLLIYQWRQGGLPNDYQRLTRIATSLPTTWSLLKSKFPESDGMLKNPVMEEIRTRRLIHKEKQKNNIRKRYQTSTKHDTKEVTKTLPLEREKEIEKEMYSLGKSENPLPGPGTILQQMADCWQNTFPTYTRDFKHDAPALREMAEFIFIQNKIPGDFGDPEKFAKVLDDFQRIADQVNRETFWRNKPLKAISHNIQEFFNKIKNPQDGKAVTGHRETSGKSAGALELLEKLKANLGTNPG